MRPTREDLDQEYEEQNDLPATTSAPNAPFLRYPAPLGLGKDAYYLCGCLRDTPLPTASLFSRVLLCFNTIWPTKLDHALHCLRFASSSADQTFCSLLRRARALNAWTGYMTRSDIAPRG